MGGPMDIGDPKCLNGDHALESAVLEGLPCPAIIWKDIRRIAWSRWLQATHIRGIWRSFHKAYG